METKLSKVIELRVDKAGLELLSAEFGQAQKPISFWIEPESLTSPALAGGFFTTSTT